MEELSKRMRKIRIERGFSQGDVAKSLYLTRQTISKWENSKSVPDIFNLVLLSDLYSVSFSELTGITDPLQASEKQNIRQENKEKEALKLKKKMFVLSVIAACIVLFAYALGSHLSMVKTAKTYDELDFNLYGVKNVVYDFDGEIDSGSENLYEFLAKGDYRIKSIELSDGSIITDLSYENLVELDLMSKNNKWHKESTDIHPINVFYLWRYESEQENG